MASADIREVTHVPPTESTNLARWLDPALPGALLARRFAVTRPGFDRDEVLDLLAEVASGMAALQRTVREYERALADVHGD